MVVMEGTYRTGPDSTASLFVSVHNHPRVMKISYSRGERKEVVTIDVDQAIDDLINAFQEMGG